MATSLTPCKQVVFVVRWSLFVFSDRTLLFKMRAQKWNEIIFGTNWLIGNLICKIPWKWCSVWMTSVWRDWLCQEHMHNTQCLMFDEWMQHSFAFNIHSVFVNNPMENSLPLVKRCSSCFYSSLFPRIRNKTHIILKWNTEYRMSSAGEFTCFLVHMESEINFVLELFLKRKTSFQNWSCYFQRNMFQFHLLFRI